MINPNHSLTRNLLKLRLKSRRNHTRAGTQARKPPRRNDTPVQPHSSFENPSTETLNPSIRSLESALRILPPAPRIYNHQCQASDVPPGLSPSLLLRMRSSDSNPVRSNLPPIPPPSQHLNPPSPSPLYLHRNLSHRLYHAPSSPLPLYPHPNPSLHFHLDPPLPYSQNLGQQLTRIFRSVLNAEHSPSTTTANANRL